MILRLHVNAVYPPFVGQIPTGQANLDPAPEEAHTREPSSKNPSQGQQKQKTLTLSHTLLHHLEIQTYADNNYNSTVRLNLLLQLSAQVPGV